MSKVQFIRGLWGSDEKTLEYVKGAADIDSKISPKVYVYGDNNYEFLTQLNKNCELIDGRPVPYEDNCRIKLAVIEKALMEYPEIVFVDWHIALAGDMPFNLQSLREGSPIKAALRMYKKRNCKWRTDDQRKISASDFLYIRGVRVVKELIEVWEGMEKPVTLEQVLMKYIDHLTGRWRGSDYYKDYFEIPCFAMSWEKEIYGEKKTNPSFISLKDLKEVGEQSSHNQLPHPAVDLPKESEQEVQEEEAQEEVLERPIVVEKTVLSAYEQNMLQTKIYNNHPIEMDTWSINFSKAR